MKWKEVLPLATNPSAGPSPPRTPLSALFSASTSLLVSFQPGSLTSLLSRFWCLKEEAPSLPPLIPCAKYHGEKGDKDTIQHNPCSWEVRRQVAHGTVLGPFPAIIRRKEPFRPPGTLELPVVSLSAYAHCVREMQSPFPVPSGPILFHSAQKKWGS